MRGASRTSGRPPPRVYSPLALKLHAFGLERLHDPNWTGMELYDRLKRHARGREEPLLLHDTAEEGLLFHLGKWLYEDYVEREGYAEGLDGEYLAWYLDDLIRFLRTHGARRSDPIKSAERLVAGVEQLFDDDEEAYFKLVESYRHRRAILKTHAALLVEHGEVIAAARPLYAANYASRVFHDRELCEHVARLLVTIGFDGTTSVHDETPKQWVKRKPIPEWAKRALVARERGQCGLCSANYGLELEADPHIDHIVPISKGGCNDIVNLQVLCSACNGRKWNARVPVRSSVPPYLRSKSDRT